MNKKHRRTLEAIFDDPVRSNIPWRDIEAMLGAMGAEITEGEGSRVRIAWAACGQSFTDHTRKRRRTEEPSVQCGGFWQRQE